MIVDIKADIMAIFLKNHDRRISWSSLSAESVKQKNPSPAKVEYLVKQCLKKFIIKVFTNSTPFEL